MAYVNRGDSYLNLSQYQRAIKDFEEAIRLDPELDGANGARVLLSLLLLADQRP